MVLAARKPDALHQVAASIGAADLAVPTHTGKESDCAALVAKAVERFGKVDVLVNNAATNPYFGPLLGIDMGAWDKTFEVNLKGYFFMAREVARHLQDRDEKTGSIIHIASVAGLEAAPLQGVYGMTKAAVISMTKTMAYELASSNIRVNAIRPRPRRHAVRQRHRLERRDRRRLSSRRRLSAATRHPTRSPAPPSISPSDASSFMTGHTMVIDGGLTISVRLGASELHVDDVHLGVRRERELAHFFGYADFDVGSVRLGGDGDPHRLTVLHCGTDAQFAAAGHCARLEVGASIEDRREIVGTEIGLAACADIHLFGVRIARLFAGRSVGGPFAGRAQVASGPRAGSLGDHRARVRALGSLLPLEAAASHAEETDEEESRSKNRGERCHD